MLQGNGRQRMRGNVSEQKEMVVNSENGMESSCPKEANGVNEFYYF